MRTVLAFLFMAAAGSHAAASGGIGCEGSEGSVTLEINSGVTRGMGSPVFQFQAKVTTTDKAIEPDLRAVTFAQEHLAQYWLDGEELRMVLYRERAAGDHGYVQFTVLTRAKGDEDEGTYAGRFEATYYEGKGVSAEGRTVTVDGEVTCFVE